MPEFTWQDSKDRPFNLYFDRLSGRRTVLFLCPSLGMAGAGQEIAALAEQQRAFDADDVQVFVVTGDLAGKVVDAPMPGTMWPQVVLDRGFKAGEVLGPESATAQGCAILLDSNNRLEAVFAHGGEGSYADQALAALAARPLAREPVVFTNHAPVLIVPNLIDRDHCRRLIAYWEKGQQYEGGIASDRGKHKLDTQFKVRRDVALPDMETEAQELFAIFRRRLFPEIRRVFRYHVSRAETLRLGCYDSADGGRFTPHRDDAAKHIRHRRFAMSMNLNSGEYEGGHLKFAEYGPQLYAPEAGGAVIFSCSLLHEAMPVTAGRRFAIFGFFHGEIEESERRARKAEYEYTLVDQPAKVYAVRQGG